jgi:hypothetical protein
MDGEDITVIVHGADKPLVAGQAVKLAFDVDKVLLFDSITGRRL